MVKAENKYITATDEIEMNDTAFNFKLKFVDGATNICSHCFTWRSPTLNSATEYKMPKKCPKCGRVY